MPPPFVIRHSSFTIVTAASSNHFRCLLSLLWTIAKFEPHARVIVWDIGLTAEEHSTLRDAPPFYLADWELKTFDFTKYPPHFNLHVEAGRMAFRPIILSELAHELIQPSSPLAPLPSPLLLWFDADCQLRAPLDDLKTSVKKTGVYSPCIPGAITTRLHSAARTPLGVTDDLLPKPLRDAGICGFDTANPRAIALLERWASVALDKICTAPENSTRHTHRQDAVFAVLLNQAAQKNNWHLETNHLPSLTSKQDHLTLEETKFRVGTLGALGAPPSRRRATR
jgi:hypothetical protein